MTIGYEGQNLIFLISQPRAGSTLLQRILGNHPDIHTMSEPWLLLHPIYSQRTKGVWFEFDAHVAHIAQQNFIHSLPRGEDDMYESMRQMYAYLYNQAMDGSGKSVFLDKTPRYYFIIPELYRLFPKAHFIILLRNPLGVLTSILRTWTRERWFLLHKRKQDLLSAPALLLAGIRRLGNSCVVIKYECLIQDPESEIERICKYLNLEYSPELVEYGTIESSTWRHGDKVGIIQHDKPESKNADQWLEDLQNPQVWRLAWDYLNILGEDQVNQMRYSYDDIKHNVLERKPNMVRLWFTYPSTLIFNALNWTEKTYSSERRMDRVLEVAGDEGIQATFNAVVEGLKRNKD